MPRTDVVIIGSGIAGLSVAIKVARRFPDRQCLIITKQESAESNTRYAHGGIAVVSDFVHDSFESHVADTLRAGDGLCDEAVVRHVVEQAPERLRELIDLGAEFDRDEKGELVLGREGGHKANRIIHFQDITGLNISTRLLERVKTILARCKCFDGNESVRDLIPKAYSAAVGGSSRSQRLWSIFSARRAASACAVAP